MKIIHIDSHTEYKEEEAITACIGYFDGIHAGHRELIERVLEHAKVHDTIPSMITFEPDPWIVLKKIDMVPHITSMQDRIDIAQEFGIKNYYILNFDEAMANLSVEDFHKRILNPLHIKALVCGFDFHYAKKGEGNIETLSSQNIFDIVVVDKIMYQGEKISSSKIERMIEDGEMEEVEKMLLRPYFVKGEVVVGNQIGRTYGFPTANLKLTDNYIYPKKGVYIGRVKVKDEWYTAIINVGNNPSFNYREHAIMEAHLLDFQAMIYGEEVEFHFIKRIRDEVKFNGKDELAKQLRKDLQFAKSYKEGK